jgi:hypothetical protein
MPENPLIRGLLMPTSGQLRTSQPGFRDCGAPTPDGPCKFVGLVEVEIDLEEMSAWFDCPECGSSHDDGDPRELIP